MVGYKTSFSCSIRFLMKCVQIIYRFGSRLYQFSTMDPITSSQRQSMGYQCQAYTFPWDTKPTVSRAEEQYNNNGRTTPEHPHTRSGRGHDESGVDITKAIAAGESGEGFLTPELFPPAHYFTGETPQELNFNLASESQYRQVHNQTQPSEHPVSVIGVNYPTYYFTSPDVVNKEDTALENFQWTQTAELTPRYTINVHEDGYCGRGLQNFSTVSAMYHFHSIGHTTTRLGTQIRRPYDSETVQTETITTSTTFGGVGVLQQPALASATEEHLYRWSQLSSEWGSC